MDPQPQFNPATLDPQISATVQSVVKASKVSLACGGAVLALVALAIAGQQVGPILLLAFVSWVGQIVAGFIGFGRGRRVLKQIRALNLPLELAAARRVKIWSGVGLATALFGLIGGLLALAGLALAIMALGALAGAWGRPLRIRGATVDADLGDEGTRWARGPRPAVTGLGAATREALGRMWLHDAKKEHGSVPAFSGLAWQLAALGAPAELLEGCQRSALQEIDHTHKCFALAETYLNVEIRVGPIPAMRSGMPKLGGPVAAATMIALDTLRDGCLIEDLNADFAERAYQSATDPAASALAQCIAIEEREHAELAWKILEWCASLDSRVARRIDRAAEQLPHDVMLPYSPETVAIVAKAEPNDLVEHARVPFEQWQAIYDRRRSLTVQRVRQIVRAASRSAVARAAAA